MVPQKADLTVLPCQDVVAMPVKKQSSERDEESPDGSLGEGAGGERIPLRKWVMHGAVMFGREFCYAMETALVTPVLLQIGLPEQYYSLTWFLSPILGLILTPLIGSASDRCTLKWGRRRPFILALCVGVLLGVSLFLNGSLLGLALGDVPSRQPIGIVLTVLGVVLLDFSADASDGPIRAYLLDVADTEEQDMALNIHAFSAGLGGAVGYVLGGLDWTSTILGTAFKSQEQILFVFATVIFTISVILHMFSIKEESFEARGDTPGEGDSDSLSSSGKLKGGLAGPRSIPQLDVIGEEDTQSERELFINVDRVRSKSDSVLAMPDATIELDSDLDQDAHFLADIEPSIFQDYPQDFYPGTPQRHYSGWGIQDQEVPQPEAQADSQLPLFHQDPSPYYSREHMLLNNQTNQGAKLAPAAPSNHTAHGANSQGRMPGLRPSNTSATAGARRFPHTFYRQPSFTFSYYGRVGSARYRHRRNTMGNPAGANLRIKTSQSMNDIYEHMQRRQQRRELQQSSTTLSSSDSESDEEGTTVKLLWLSMLKMPPQLLRLCVCHLLTWFSIIAEAVFYTDFMGQVIYDGKPTAPANSTELQNYHKGVQMGCWGLVVYAATAAVCSGRSYSLEKYTVWTATCTVWTATCTVWTATCTVWTATCTVWTATCTVWTATCTVWTATCTVWTATCTVWTATCTVWTATCTVWTATCTVWTATWTATCTVWTATCTVWTATCTVWTATCTVWTATCTVWTATCTVWTATCTVWTATCTVWTATCTVWTATCTVWTATCTVWTAMCTVWTATCTVWTATCTVWTATCISKTVLQKYLDNYDLSIKVIYILGTLSFSLGTAVMAIFSNVYVAMVMISTMGIISMSISYCPYALLGQYHENKQYIHHSPGKSRRGFGIDCAILSCQVYIAQILVASALSTVVDVVGSVRVIPMMASGGSFLGFLTSTFLVIYPDSSTPTTTQDQEGYGEDGAPALVAPEAGPSGSSMQEPVVLLKMSPKGSSSTTNYESTI
ncbi:solute carrier family 45 member 4 isoform X2 [Salvelinus namaycush]|uniref:Solute carrier family 45 member 4 isoform X2 n=1 Tax=Salvelinus namaycush TaxID=8040 RepID=A0A8U0QXB6_SALNM|nr:solute carrier family 45 member 4 isoform X2 [Salvelinus namaycush]